MVTDYQLTKNFWLSEFEKQCLTPRGQDGVSIMNYLQILCEEILQPVRDWLNKPITVTSGYRSVLYEMKKGRSGMSQHTQGKAADIVARDMDLIFLHIAMYMDFDQLIWEFGNNEQPNWIHVSYNPAKKNRKQILRSVKNKNGKTVYLPISITNGVLSLL